MGCDSTAGALGAFLTSLSIWGGLENGMATSAAQSYSCPVWSHNLMHSTRLTGHSLGQKAGQRAWRTANPELVSICLRQNDHCCPPLCPLLIVGRDGNQPLHLIRQTSSTGSLVRDRHAFSPLKFRLQYPLWCSLTCFQVCPPSVIWSYSRGGCSKLTETLWGWEHLSRVPKRHCFEIIRLQTLFQNPTLHLRTL